MSGENTAGVPSAPRRAFTAIIVVAYMAAYICLAWVAGDHLTSDSAWFQMAYYPIAGILWVPGAYWIIKKLYKS
ncbi:DUF2842 domain-containing protein [Aestuariispira insulae]|uniref:DUF2842 domain-containing protein n=1 Tax=Aestuariispira insulae TaxID=1461337 RepID=UPI0011C053CA|nr:DUF2842 domain-containing protein [Aestuariispira insulae]